MVFWILYRKKRLSHPIRGIKNGFLYDSVITIEVTVGLLVLTSINYFLGPFSSLEQLLLILCFFLVIIAEFFNSAVETALDHIHPDHHEEIGLSKDLAARGVMWAGIFSLFCLYFVLSGSLPS